MRNSLANNVVRHLGFPAHLSHTPPHSPTPSQSTSAAHMSAHMSARSPIENNDANTGHDTHWDDVYDGIPAFVWRRCVHGQISESIELKENLDGLVETPCFMLVYQILEELMFLITMRCPGFPKIGWKKWPCLPKRWHSDAQELTETIWISRLPSVMPSFKFAKIISCHQG